MNFKNILRELKFPENIENIINRSYFEKESEIQKISETAYKSDSFDFPLLACDPTTSLTVIINLLVGKYLDYEAKNISHDIIIDTFKDVSLRASLYFEKTKRVGVSKDDVIWFRHIMNTNIFKIGSLQYQPFKMIYLDEATIGEPYMKFSKEQYELLPVNTPVINCHIQNGTDISSEQVDDSFIRAKQFFNDIFPDIKFKYFICYSWLLYPPMTDYLSDKSNIKEFAKKFRIIGHCQDNEQALNDIDTKRKSQLSRIDKERLGFACGIIEIED